MTLFQMNPLLKNYTTNKKIFKNKKSLIVIVIPYILLYKTLIKNLLKTRRRTFKIKEIPNS